MLRFDSIDKHIKACWGVRCDCGNEVVIQGCSMTNSNTLSCGCIQKGIISRRMTKHKMRNKRAYPSWVSMKYRCLNVKNKAYKNYGGRRSLQNQT